VGRGGLRPRGPAPRLPRKGESGPPCGRPPGDPRDGTLSKGGGAWRPALVPLFPRGEGGTGVAVPPGRSTAGLELARTRGIRPFN
jgi:hypothetical protein